MKKIILMLAVVFMAVSVRAADGVNWRDWYNNLIRGLRAKVEKRLEPKAGVAAVAAVRGANQNGDPRALYWKGSVSDLASKKLDGERKQLGDALQLAADGDIPGGRAAIDKFMKDNPDSVYQAEAKEALDRLPAEASPAAVTPRAAEQPAKAAASAPTAAPESAPEAEPSAKTEKNPG